MEFVTDRTYSMTSVCDAGCRWDYTVTRRTAKTVWLREVGSTKPAKAFRVSVYCGEEQVSPLGRYSMSPILGAGREV